VTLAEAAAMVMVTFDDGKVFLSNQLILSF
jgi:hypothetical protein